MRAHPGHTCASAAGVASSRSGAGRKAQRQREQETAMHTKSPDAGRNVRVASWGAPVWRAIRRVLPQRAGVRL